MRIPEEISLVGLAAKAGKVVSGEFATEKAVKTQKAFLVIIAQDASENTRKKFHVPKKTTRSFSRGFLCARKGSARRKKMCNLF